MTQEGVSIYALIDPRDGAVRYIGKAVHPQRRLAGHLREMRRRTPLYRWIGELRKRGYSPSMTILSTCPQADWPNEERRLIAWGRALGFLLLNVADGGDEPHCPTETRRENGVNLNARLARDPRAMKIRNAKRELATGIRNGWVMNSTRAKMRAMAEEFPELFGSWANTPDRMEGPDGRPI